jgi:hypothetical protein
MECYKSLLLEGLQGYQSSQRLINNGKNKQYKEEIHQYIKQYINTKQTVPKYSTRCYENVSTRIA